MMLRPLLLGLIAPLLATPFAHAAETAAEPLHIIHHIVHAEQDKAELCLQFNHTLADLDTSARTASSLKLESDGKTIPIANRNISIGGDQLCVASLDHRKDYQLSVAPLRNAKGEKISAADSLTFTVPPRHAALSFLMQESRDGLAMWPTANDTATLRSINNDQVLLELYRITDPARMAEAWGQRLQTTLAPSESLYFARHNGALAWKKDVTPGNTQDNVTENKIDFGDDKFAPSLYLLAASDPEAKPAKVKSKDEAERDNALTPTAAIWLLRSDLSLHGLRDEQSFRLLVDNADGAAAMSNIRTLAFNRDQEVLGEARSDAHGQAQITPNADKGDTQVLLALADKGDVAFLDASQDMTANPVLPPLNATMSSGQNLYQPGENIQLSLTIRDLHKRTVNLTGSVVQLLRPNNSLYDSQPVNLDALGTAKVVLTAPVPAGIWHLVWRQGDNKLAEMDARISANPLAPRLTVSADRGAFSSDSGVNLTIRSIASNGSAAPYISGHVELNWVKPDHALAAWKDYVFDNGEAINPEPKNVGSFLTDASGAAHLHVTLPATNQAPTLRQVQLHVVSDDSFDAFDPEPLAMPVRPADIIVGIKPRNNKGHFAENSLAHFDVVALDAEGQRRTLDDLTYQIFEQGRIFEWYQSEGRWDYRPQQQRRRRGGGTVNFDNNQAAIEWPVTSGAYQIEISNAAGQLLARLDFNAGWGLSDKEDDAESLALKATPALLQPGKEQKISFNLPRAALVTALIADDHLRGIVHANYAAGSNSIAFTPTADWGSHVVVRVLTRDAAGRILLSTNNDTAPAQPRTAIKTATTAKPILPPIADQTLHETAKTDLAPTRNWSLADIKLHGPALAFVAPQPIFAAPSLLAEALQRQPVTTRGLAHQLQVVHMWQENIVAANLMQEAEWHALQNNLEMRLLDRQQTDGGFGAFADDSASDSQSTAAAIEALMPLNDALARPSIEQASVWLRHQLENTWFEEKDRAARAGSYAALAAADKLDVASLHYYSDTSADKTLPILAEAQIAYAFAAINDRAASNYWLDKIEKNNIPPEALPVLMANQFFAPNTATAALENASKQATNKTDDNKTLSAFLIALWRAEDRTGTWRLSIGRDEKAVHGVYVLPLPEKNPPVLHNPSNDRTLAITVATSAKAPNKTASQRHIYALDGSETSYLGSGTVYLVMAEGAWPNDGAARFAVHDNPQPSLVPMSCALQATSSEHFLGWLQAKAPSTVTACEKSASGLDVVITRSDKEQGAWRIAYLAKAASSDAGNARAASIRALSNPDDVNRGDKDAQH